MALMSQFSHLAIAHCGNAAPLVCSLNGKLFATLCPAFIKGMALFILYCKLFKLHYEDRVNHFLIGFFMPVIIPS